jgi:hypothetical protein
VIKSRENKFESKVLLDTLRSNIELERMEKDA